MLMIEAPQQMQERLTIPQDHLAACQAAKIPFQGNAAGNAEDFLDLSGQNVQQKFLPNGFTARGIVALAFSCLSALLGVAFIVVYGLSDVKFHLENQAGSSDGEKSRNGVVQTIVTKAYQG